MSSFRTYAHLALRDGLIAGMLLGSVHAAVLAVAGLYAATPGDRVLASALRWAGLLGVCGGAVALVGVALWCAGGRRLRRGPWRNGPRALRAGWLPPAAYALLWALMLGHGAWTQPEERGRFAAAALLVALLGAVALALATRRRPRTNRAVDTVARSWVRRVGAWVPPLSAAACLITPHWIQPPTPHVSEGELQRPQSPQLQAAAQAPFAGRPWNLLLITIDTLRADHLGCYGYVRDTTPALDALARQGVRMEQALCPRPTTSPSFATLFTGFYPSQHGVQFTLETLASENVTLAEILRASGYSTAAVITNGNLFPKFGFDQGFDTYLYGHVRSDEGRQLALDWLQDGRADDRPWFLWFHSTDPHAPYNPPPPYDAMFPPAAANDWVARQTSLYDGEIRFTDDQIAQVLQFIRERPELRDNTLIVFTADHGESLGEHDYFFQHGELPYEQTARVPLIFAAPRVLPAGMSCPALVTGADLLPTVLSALHVPIPAHLQGTSYLPSLMGLDALGSHPFVVLEAGFGDHIRLGRTRTLRRPDFKYVQRLRRWARVPNSPTSLAWSMNALLEGSLQPDEVYDLAADPQELHNLFGQDPARDARERRLLDAFTRRTSEGQALQPGPKALLDQATLEELRSLGYIE